jgi:hypothetical protein
MDDLIRSIIGFAVFSGIVAVIANLVSIFTINNSKKVDSSLPPEISLDEPVQIPIEDIKTYKTESTGRKSWCWSCKSAVKDDVNDVCDSCGWIKCPSCSACRSPEFGGCNSLKIKKRAFETTLSNNKGTTKDTNYYNNSSQFLLHVIHKIEDKNPITDYQIQILENYRTFIVKSDNGYGAYVALIKNRVLDNYTDIEKACNLIKSESERKGDGWWKHVNQKIYPNDKHAFGQYWSDATADMDMEWLKYEPDSIQKDHERYEERVRQGLE